MERKKLTFATEKCKVLKFGIIKSHSSNLAIGNDNLEVVSNFRYLGDEIDSKGSYSVLCKTRAQRPLGTTAELISLCKEVKFGKEQIPNMILLYYSVFLPRIIYNAEAWSSLTEADIQCLQKGQLHYLRRVLEIPKSTPTAALFPDLDILPIQYEIEKKQLHYLKYVLEKNADDPVQQTQVT